jgi:hypothetical protein
MTEHKHVNLHVSKFEVPSKLKTLAMALVALGVLTFIFGLIKNQERLWTSYLTAFFYFSCLGLSGLFWIAINSVSRAGWSVSIRRFAEATTSFIPIMGLGGLLLAFFGFKYLYPWANQEVVANNPVIAAKTGYLNSGFFIVRLFIFAIGCWLFRAVMVGNSLKQDKTGDESLTNKNVGPAVGFIVFFALMFSLFSVDLLMSLLPTWYSTIFGVYTFSGLFQSGMAFLAIVVILMKRHYVKGYVTEEHQHDVVKYLKGFSIFWAYIAFSQFMLIWYANLPEETEFFIMRSQNGWLWISFSLLIFRFIVPFLALLPRGAKRTDGHVLLVSTIVLIMQYVDIYWMVYPNFFDGHVTFGFWEIGVFAGFAGIFLLTIFSFWSKHSLVPLKDPRLHEAINHHVAY